MQLFYVFYPSVQYTFPITNGVTIFVLQLPYRFAFLSSKFNPSCFLVHQIISSCSFQVFYFSVFLCYPYLYCFVCLSSKFIIWLPVHLLLSSVSIRFHFLLSFIFFNISSVSYSFFIYFLLMVLYCFFCCIGQTML